MVGSRQEYHLGRYGKTCIGGLPGTGEDEKAMRAGVEFSACIECAQVFVLAETLESLGVEVIPWGKRLTNILVGKKNLLTV